MCANRAPAYRRSMSHILARPRHGAVVVRLDTRHDLVEALALYARRGYVDVPAFNEDRYAQRWLALRL